MADESDACCRLCVTLAFVFIGGIITIIMRADQEVPVRQGVTGSCPSLGFPPSVDEEGTSFSNTFAAKREYGSWNAAIELGEFSDGDFSGTGPKLVVDGCSWLSPWGRNRFIKVLDAHGGVLASIDSDPFSWGWSIKIRDCEGKIKYKVEEHVKGRSMFHAGKGADLTVSDAAGAIVATSSYDWALIGTNVLTLSTDNAVLGRATSPAVAIGTKEWRIYAQGDGDEALILAAVVGYKTWADKSCGEDCRGDFDGTCEKCIMVFELIVGTLLAGVCFIGLEWCCVIVNRVHSRLAGYASALSSCCHRLSSCCCRKSRPKQPDWAWRSAAIPNPLCSDKEAAAVAAAALFGEPVAVQPIDFDRNDWEALPLPPTVHHDTTVEDAYGKSKFTYPATCPASIEDAGWEQAAGVEFQDGRWLSDDV
eukprot:SAG11_NODE_113_length_16061_cov_16.161143_6_plen_421_part_00